MARRGRLMEVQGVILAEFAAVCHAPGSPVPATEVNERFRVWKPEHRSRQPLPTAWFFQDLLTRGYVQGCQVSSYRYFGTGPNPSASVDAYFVTPKGRRWLALNVAKIPVLSGTCWEELALRRTAQRPARARGGA